MEGSIRLKDGRLLGYGIYGDPNGQPVIDLHGIPGSRREAELFNKFAGHTGLCFIGIDRPGYGVSTPKRGYRVTDFPADLAALADALNLDKLTLLGYSGGGPFALACARFIPERIRKIAVVSGVGPSTIGSEGMHESNRKKFNLAQRLPWLARTMLTAAFAPLRKDPDRLPEQLHKIWQQLPDPDQLALANADFSNGIIEVTRDAIANGVSGWVNEEVLMAQPWGFEIGDIRLPGIQLWHGVEDRNVPAAMAKAVAARVPDCEVHFLEEEAHLSILFNHGEEIIGKLTS
jgi:pimeloyl-ACP methyl ester carboxylesterase